MVILLNDSSISDYVTQELLINSEEELYCLDDFCSS
jgi:hypothetical protein